MTDKDIQQALRREWLQAQHVRKILGSWLVSWTDSTGWHGKIYEKVDSADVGRALAAPGETHVFPWRGMNHLACIAPHVHILYRKHFEFPRNNRPLWWYETIQEDFERRQKLKEISKG